MAKLKALFVVGTRPDTIKTAPVVLEFQKYSDRVETVLVSTGQHREMLDQVLDVFRLKPNFELAVMEHGQSLASLTSKIVLGLDEIFRRVKPDIVFAQGDTTTTFVAGLASFYLQIPFAHIEAGLRTETIHNPFPEEFNRRAVGLVARTHFPPTSWARENLLREGVPDNEIVVTGNTGIDAIKTVSSLVTQTWFPNHLGRIALLTTHRRENWGEPQERIAKACRQILDEFEEMLLVVPMHKNPHVRETIQNLLGDHSRVELIEPPEYPQFVKLMERSNIILTDSGGVQEEAPTFGIPVLVLRNTTERPEGVAAGTAKLVGTQIEIIVKAARELLSSESAYQLMAKAISPYGDGLASQRIRHRVLADFGIESEDIKSWMPFKP